MKRAVLSFLLIVSTNVGCHWLSKGVETVDGINDPKDDVILHDCRNVARAVKADSGSGDAGLQAYRACVKEAGI